ncbi:TPA: hypothetical protein N0F65_008579 [Lagenidium giganteum]|uniref:Uncharacterized protein n=1 Tax=Lagenidium giganteum TaxID=4803 RepID=A0AAV2Z246_9STRA|nr:TPA: hypothetical protein N0F65_008579 [Lagenidium giganteum]
MANEHVGSNNEAAAEPEDVVDDPNVLKLSNLPAARLCISSTDRAEVLGVIRHALVAGQDVLLWSDCEQTHESVSETKLMQQQLCTQSLALCHREQELVPEQNSSVVQLHLIPRLRDH